MQHGQGTEIFAWRVAGIIMKPPIFNSMPADLDHFGMFELSFNLDPLKNSKFVHEILTLRRLMVETSHPQG